MLTNPSTRDVDIEGSELHSIEITGTSHGLGECANTLIFGPTTRQRECPEITDIRVRLRNGRGLARRGEGGQGSHERCEVHFDK